MRSGAKSSRPGSELELPAVTLLAQPRQGAEAIAHARREIATIEADILAGNPDRHGRCRGVVDWSCELRRVEQNDPTMTAGGLCGESKIEILVNRRFV